MILKCPVANVRNAARNSDAGKTGVSHEGTFPNAYQSVWHKLGI